MYYYIQKKLKYLVYYDGIENEIKAQKCLSTFYLYNKLKILF